MIRPAGYSSDEFDEYEESGNESGFEDVEYSKTDDISLKLVVENAIKNGLVQELKEALEKIENIAEFTLNNGWKPLTYAAFIGNSEILEYLIQLEPGIDINDSKFSLYTPLMAACNVSENVENFDDKLRCLEILLNLKVNVNFKDRYGMTGLMTASKSGQSAMVEMLILHGGHVEDCDNDGWSALFYAVGNDHLNVVLTLLKYKADINKVDRNNRYSYDIALEKGYEHIADLLKPKIIVDSDLAELNLQITRCETSQINEIFERDVNYFEDVLNIVEAVAPNMKRYLNTFLQNNITLRQLLLFKSEEELKKIGINFSMHRYNLLDRVQQFHLHEWSANSFGLYDKNGELDERRFSRLNNVLIFMVTINRQIYVQRTTMLYIYDDIIRNASSNQNTLLSYLKSIKSILMSIKIRVKKIREFNAALRIQSRPFLMAQEIL